MHSDKSGQSAFRWIIQSPARLHFGLVEICPGQPWLYGGCGMAIEEPATRLILEASACDTGQEGGWHIDRAGVWHHRMEEALQRAHQRLLGRPAMIVDRLSEGSVIHRLRIETPPMSHAGLGSGTQLACCVATLVAASLQPREVDRKETTSEAIWAADESSTDSTVMRLLAEASGRGMRSQVGLGSHLFGGFIVDAGVSVAGHNQRSIQRVEVPESWRVVLARPVSLAAISGPREIEYFHRCAAPNPQRQRMLDAIEHDLLPAIKMRDLAGFGESIYRYGRYAGELFRIVQGGIYRDLEVADLVKAIRDFGITATGQSSWGPMVFAAVDEHDKACKLSEHLIQRYANKIETTITRPTNRPATLRNNPITDEGRSIA